MLARLRGLWQRLPPGLRRRVYWAANWTGLPYVLSYVATYRGMHAQSNFAGNFLHLKQEYSQSSEVRRRELDAQFDAILAALIMRNGVAKSTYRGRTTRILEKVLADDACRVKQSPLRVLDIPSSTGIASLDCLALLRRRYPVDRYVLADLFQHIQYDTDRQCIFDEDSELLQVKFKTRFFAIHRAHVRGEDYSYLTRVLLSPVDLVSWYLKRRYSYSGDYHRVPIVLIHPEVEAQLREHVLRVEKADVFVGVEDVYDLILCFNLLQRNYFSPAQIARGIENLKNALSEGGLLVVGRPDVGSADAVWAARKRAGELVWVKREGCL